MTYPYLKHLDEAIEAHHVRELFLKSCAFIKEEEVQAAFFAKIDELVIRHTGKRQTIQSLDDLREDIMEEIESGSAFKAKRFNPHENRKMNTDPKVTAREKFMAIVESRIEDEKAIAVASSPVTDGEVETPSLDLIEKAHILKVLKKCGGNRTLASRVLGISIRTLRNKILKYIKEEGSLDMAEEPRGKHGEENH